MAISFNITYKKNDGSGTELYCDGASKEFVDYITSVGQNWGMTPENWSRDGFSFKHWNTAEDDSGTSYNGGDLYTGRSVTLYAIWQADTPAGADVSIALGNTEIASLSDTGSVTLATAGTYVNEDITIDYTKSGGGVLVVYDMNGTLDKTWQEIHDSAPLVWQTDGDGGYRILVAVFEEEGDFVVTFAEPQPDRNIMRSYVATSASGYPRI